MNIAQNTFHIKQKKILYFFAIMSLLLSFHLLFSPHASYASTIDNGDSVPASIKAWLPGACAGGGGHTVGQATWLSLAGSPTITETTINAPGDPVDLQLNILVFKCVTGTPTGVLFTSYRWISGYYTISNLPGVNLPLPSPANKIVTSPTNDANRYSTDHFSSFPINTAGIIAPFTDVNLHVATKQFNWFTPSNVLGCVESPSSPPRNIPDPPGVNGDYLCSDSPLDVNFRINLNSSPDVTADDTCTGISVTTTGSRVDVYGPGGGIGSVAGQSGLLTLAGIVSPGTLLDVYGIAGSGQNGNKLIQHKWVLPSNCNFDFNVMVTRPKPILYPDEEDPKTADFGATFAAGRKVNGLKITCKFYILTSGGSRRDIAGGLDNVATPTDASGNFSCDSIGKNLSLGPTPLVAGDQICVDSGVDPLSGQVNTAGDITLNNGAGPIVRTCSHVTNSPYVSFFGNDVKAGGNSPGTNDCTSQKADITAKNKGGGGSGVEFAAFALGAIGGFNSASQSAVGSLNFPNAGANIAGGFGNYGTECPHDYWADRAGTDLGSSVIDLTGRNGDFQAQSGASISTSTIKKGQHVYVYVNGDVTITGNGIGYESTGWSTRSDIPSFYLVANGNIYIDQSVKELYGVYVAQNGTINTCTTGSTVYDNISNAKIYAECANQLVVNGSFIAKKVNLLRTFGSLRNSSVGENPFSTASHLCSASAPASARSCAAEVFAFNPSIYLAESPEPDKKKGGSGDNYDFITSLAPFL